MKIVARMFSGKEIWLEAFPVHTVKDVKRTIQEYELIPAGQQRLFYNGTELDGNRILHEYDIRFMVNRLDLVVVPPDAASDSVPPDAASDSEYTSDSE